MNELKTKIAELKKRTEEAQNVMSRLIQLRNKLNSISFFSRSQYIREVDDIFKGSQMEEGAVLKRARTKEEAIDYIEITICGLDSLISMRNATLECYTKYEKSISFLGEQNGNNTGKF